MEADVNPDVNPGDPFPDGMESETFCPDCGMGLVVRTNRANGNQFLGCPDWPACTHTQGIPESWRMKRAGQKELF